MDNIVVGTIAVLVGALLCFRGYVTMRLIISLFGAFVGFVLGVGLVSGASGSGFGQQVLGWIVGVVGALVFGLLAYFSYQVAIVLGMASIGFAIGTSLTAAGGVQSQAAIIAVGLVAGIVLAVVSVATNLPAILLVVLTALAGASVTMTGALVVAGATDLGRLTTDALTAAPDRSWWWYIGYGLLAVLGILAQFRALSGARRPMRQQWSPPVPAPAGAR
jgi:Domain of unknown function (DUF4203)